MMLTLYMWYKSTFLIMIIFFFFFQAEDGIRDVAVTGVQTCALPILGLVEIVAAPNLAVVLDHDSRGLHVQLLEQLEQAQAVMDLARLAVERDRDVTHRLAASHRVAIISWRRRAASARSAAA